MDHFGGGNMNSSGRGGRGGRGRGGRGGKIPIWVYYKNRSQMKKKMN
jgi:hypothetical protein